MKYFFLSDGWLVGRVWEFGGLWDESAWRRRPQIQRLNLGMIEHGEKLWLYQAEEAVLMVEVKPSNSLGAGSSIGQVVLRRLMSADQALERLTKAEDLFNP
ncbi:hypothetical protein [Spirulina subsalsa]|uniref:hypothetical protein n=1 Tax=Spirulina subsalsa TaxID=54311 RepID=UPI0002EB5002|nr:hypothetical protein [Spirulina subsalsa]